MSTQLTSFPTDILRGISAFLGDEDLTSCQHVCHIVKVVALVALLERYRPQLDWDEQASFSSPAVAELEENLSVIYNLKCRFDLPSVGALTRVVASLPNLRCLDLELARDERLGGEKRKDVCAIREAFLCMVLAFWKCRGGLVILRGSGWMVRVLETAPRRTGKNQIKKWLGLGIKSIHLENFCSQSSITSNWILVDPNRLDAQILVVEQLDFQSAWATTVIPVLHLPALVSVYISKKARLPIAHLLDFLTRFPTVEYFGLEHFSLAREYVRLKREPRRWSLPNIDTLEAPLPYHPVLLSAIDLPSLQFVTIGVAPAKDTSSFPSRRGLWWKLDVFDTLFDEWFSFDTLGKVLHMLADTRMADLFLVLPGGSRAAGWLTVGDDVETRPEKRLIHLKSVVIYPETDRPISESLRGLFSNWFELFPGLTSTFISFRSR